MSTRVENLHEFLVRIADLKPTHEDDLFVFRGQGRDWPVVPGIARKPYTEAAILYRTDQQPRPAEYKLFVRFRDATVTYQPAWVQVPAAKEHAWRQVVLAQHYGLPTRLLDWTTKPLVALFFAVESEKDHQDDGVVHVFETNLRKTFTLSALARENQEPPLYAFNEVGLLWPPDIDSRVTSQGSMFTIGRAPRAPVSSKPFCIIPAGCKLPLLRELRRLGITWGQLFPSIEGLTRTIKEESLEWAADIR
jgi:hypothetical protein